MFSLFESVCVTPSIVYNKYTHKIIELRKRKKNQVRIERREYEEKRGSVGQNGDMERSISLSDDV